MDEISTKYILFAVGLFIIIIVLTSIISSYSSVQGVYKTVLDTNISIKDRYDDIYSMYNDATLNGVDLVNTLKKYEDDDKVDVYYPGKTKTPLSNEIQNAISTLGMTGCTESEYLNILMSEDNNRAAIYSTTLEYMRSKVVLATTLFYRTKFTVEVVEDDSKYEITFTKIT